MKKSLPYFIMAVCFLIFGIIWLVMGKVWLSVIQFVCAGAEFLIALRMRKHFDKKE